MSTISMAPLLEKLVELIEIPESHYQLAVERYDSVSRHFHRRESTLLEFEPRVYSQGSFRYGTVIRPLFEGEYYDLDLVCQLEKLSKSETTQAQLRELIGKEVRGYARAHNFNKPAIPKRRCWRLEYADDVSFHIDILPAVSEDVDIIQALIRLGVEPQFAELAIAISDTDHVNFDIISRVWPASNSDGFGDWFVERMRPSSIGRRRQLVEARLYASIDDVPVYAWKTPLQRVIQILKRHRDVMFQDNPELKPISMIITTLAAEAYRGELDLYDALAGVLDRMLDYVEPSRPRVKNPVNPLEDFADRWNTDPNGEQLYQNFRAWHRQAQSDLASISYLSGADLDKLIGRSFDVNFSSRQSPVSIGSAAAAVPAVHIARQPVRIAAPARPWGA